MLTHKFKLLTAFVLIIVIFLYINEIKLINSIEMTNWQEDFSADCAVVLTGSSGRIQAGIDLLSRRKINKLIISGVFPSTRIEDIFKLRSVYGEIDLNDIVLEKISETTLGNAQYSINILEALQCRSFILVTSKLHMYRSLRTFREYTPENLTMYAYPTLNGYYDSDVFELFIEATKSIFYRLL